MKLFRTKVLPTLTYGLEEIWEFPSLRQLQDLESLKPRYHKSVLGVSKFSEGNLPNTGPENANPSAVHTGIWGTTTRATGKRDSTEESFYSTDAMVNREWTQEEYDLMTRFAIHGFHHRVCSRTTFHLANHEYICLLCSEQCDIYHVMECKRRTVSPT